MTDASPLCSNLDAYLDGELADADATAFVAHAEACGECAADLAAARLLSREWAALAAVTAPPSVVDAALRQAKRGAADRQPAPGRRRRLGRLTRIVAAGVLLLAVAGTALWLQRTPPPSPSDAQAINTPSTPTDTSATPDPETTPEPLLASEPEQRPQSPPRRQLETASPAGPSPPRVQSEPPAPLEQVAQRDVPPDSVAQAQDDLMLALSLIADAQSRAGSSVSTEIERAAGALNTSHVF